MLRNKLTAASTSVGTTRMLTQFAYMPTLLYMMPSRAMNAVDARDDKANALYRSVPNA